MQKKHLFILVFAMMMILIVAGCNPTNVLPLSFENWTPTSLTLTTNASEQVAFSVSLSKQANCSWQASGGSLSTTSGLTTTWTAPATPTATPYTVTATANDGKTSINKTWTVTVNANNGNNAPTIDAHNPNSPYAIQVNQSVELSVDASDPDNDTLTYTWTKTAGTLNTTTGDVVNWTAPATAGTYTVKVVVSDGTANAEFTWTMNVTEDTPSNAIIVDEDITTPTTWESNKVYLITKGDLQVSNTLTIQPGAIIKFAAESYLSMSTIDAGIIKALGTATAPIIFTSANDDRGGDTNGDGNASTPQVGDWDKILINGGTGSIFTYCQFYYGGSDAATLRILDKPVQVINCTFAYNNGITDQAIHGVLDADEAAANTKIQNNIFYNNVLPLTINTLYNIDDTNQFSNPNNSSEINNYNGIFVQCDTVANALSWTETEVPYVLTDTLTIDTGASLTLGDKVIVKIDDNNYISVSGTLNADAINFIIFTSYHDDLHGGDTNGNGTETTANAGDWDEVDIIGSLNSKFKKCEFYYAGSYNDTVLDLGFTASSVQNCTFAHNLGDNGTLDASSALYGTIISNNIFYDNIIPLKINGKFSIDDSNIFHNPTNQNITNRQNGIFLSSDFEVDNTITWEETEIPFVINNGTVLDNKSLTLGDNVVVKFTAGASLSIDGTLNAKATNQIIFTSFKDDILTDTDNDTTVTPERSDWDQIYIGGNGSAFFNNCTFTYAGTGGYAINLCGGKAEVTNCTFAHNNGYALNADGNSLTKIQYNRFYDNEHPLRINAEYSLDDSNYFQSTDGTLKNDFNRIDFDYLEINKALAWSETEVPYCSNAGFKINENFSLTLGNNVIIKMADGQEISIIGTLNQGSNNVFTSLKDDDNGGDSNNDGTTTSPAVGDWEGIWSDSMEDYITAWTNILYDSYAYPTNY